MANHDKSVKQAIAPYLKKRVTAALDGDLFDHEPATFRFRFLDSKKLKEELVDNYYDELCSMGCLDETDGDWINDDLVPVAAVSTVSDDEDEDDDELYEFAWVFLNFAAANPPGVIITTSDDWGTTRTVANLAALKLSIA